MLDKDQIIKELKKYRTSYISEQTGISVNTIRNMITARFNPQYENLRILNEFIEQEKTTTTSNS